VAVATCIDTMPSLDTNQARHNGDTKAMPQFDGGRAFIIGVADYTDPNLKIASGITVKEAQKVESLLKKQTVCAYPEAGVKLLTNPDREYLLREFKAFVEKVASDSTASTVILFYAGHGVEGTDKKYYFTTRDTKLTTELKANPDTAVGSDELMAEIRKIGTKKMLFVVNACFSGNVMPSLSPGEKLPGSPPPKSLGVEFLATGEGRALISACRPDQRSYFSNSSELTYFGSGLADGLEGNGINPGSGYIGLFELYLHVYDQVTATVAKLGATQDPMITLLQGVGPFPVALNNKLGVLGPLDSSVIQSDIPKAHGNVEWISKEEVEQIRSRYIVHTEGQSTANVGDAIVQGSAAIAMSSGAHIGQIHEVDP
jgi:caspase domain-containing protein